MYMCPLCTHVYANVPCVAVYFRVLPCVAVCCRVLQCVTVCSVLKCVTVCSSAVQCVAVRIYMYVHRTTQATPPPHHLPRPHATAGMLTVSRASTSALASSRSRAVWCWPLINAQCNGVLAVCTITRDVVCVCMCTCI